QGRTAAAGLARAHPRCARRARRRPVAAHRQRQRPHPAPDAEVRRLAHFRVAGNLSGSPRCCSRSTPRVPRITLSFDNGPDPEVTPQVLGVLDKAGLRASFFVLGDKLRDPSRRAICARARAEGHWIGNHTFNHIVPLGLSPDPDIATKEIGRTQQLIGDLADERRLFRPFGGRGKLGNHLLNRSTLNFLVAGKYTCVLWNVIPEDWEDPDGWVERA